MSDNSLLTGREWEGEPELNVAGFNERLRNWASSNRPVKKREMNKTDREHEREGSTRKTSENKPTHHILTENPLWISKGGKHSVQ